MLTIRKLPIVRSGGVSVTDHWHLSHRAELVRLSRPISTIFTVLVSPNEQLRCTDLNSDAPHFTGSRMKVVSLDHNCTHPGANVSVNDGSRVIQSAAIQRSFEFDYDHRLVKFPF